jgi:hypothetical protein
MKNSQKFVIFVLSISELCQFHRKEFCGFYVILQDPSPLKMREPLKVLADQIYSMLQVSAGVGCSLLQPPDAQQHLILH